MQFDAFWNSPYAPRIKHPEPVRQLLAAAGSDESTAYDLTFYSSFAKKMLTVMKREGADTQGFARMQQSFSEAVQKVRSAIERAAAKGFSAAPRYTEMSQTGMAHLLEMIEDLSTVKDWQIHSSSDDDSTNR